MIQAFIDFINEIFNNQFIKIFEVVLTGIFAGYVLQPVPKWLNDLFDASNIFKFIMLIFIGIGVAHPLTPTTFATVIAVSGTILLLFEIFRKIEPGEGTIPTIFDVQSNNAPANKPANKPANTE